MTPTQRTVNLDQITFDADTPAPQTAEAQL